MKNYNIKETLFKELKESTTIEDLDSLFTKEEFFTKEEIKEMSPKKKIELLKECKGTKTYYSPNYEYLSEDEKLAYEETIFLKRPWRKSEIYQTLYGKKDDTK